MRTFGLGGDSEVGVDEHSLSLKLTLGPRRVLPLSLAAHLHPEAVLEALEEQIRSPHTGRLDGRFACRTGLPDRLAAGLLPQEQALYSRLSDVPVPLAPLLTGAVRLATVDRLVARGLVHLVGFTPSDAMHVLGRQGQWSEKAAWLGAALLARRRNGAGRHLAETPEAMAEAVVAQLTRQSAEAVLTACLAEDGAAVDPAASVSVDRALRRSPGIVRFALSLDRPLVGLGASASVYYPAVAGMLGAEGVIPEDADVANAIGAVVGQVRNAATVVVVSPQEGLFVASGAGVSERFDDEGRAFAFARNHAEKAAVAAARRNGADDPAVTMEEHVDAPMIEGLRKFVEARFTAVASGRPRMARV